MFDQPRLQNLGIITAGRVRLEPLCAAHAEVLFDSFTDPALYEWISTECPKTAEALAKSWICSGDNGAYLYDTYFGLDWAVTRADNDMVIGKFEADFADNGRAINLGYVLKRSAWGHGYASEAIRVLLNAFRECGVRDVHAYVTKGNSASEKVLAGLGFCVERIIPDNDCIRGQLYDDIEYVIRFANETSSEDGYK